jgi:hypothetical protein
LRLAPRSGGRPSLSRFDRGDPMSGKRPSGPRASRDGPPKEMDPPATIPPPPGVPKRNVRMAGPPVEVPCPLRPSSPSPVPVIPSTLPIMSIQPPPTDGLVAVVRGEVGLGSVGRLLIMLGGLKKLDPPGNTGPDPGEGGFSGSRSADPSVCHPSSLSAVSR